MSALFVKICYGETMKKLVSYIFLGLVLCNVGYAEKYVCSYLFNQEPLSIVFERKGSIFEKSNGAKNTIIFEDEYAIVLSNTFTYDDKSPSNYTTVIDKKNLTFVFVGLQYQDNTVIAEGKCYEF